MQNESGVNRRETDAQVLRLFFISTAVFIVIGAVIYGVFQVLSRFDALLAQIDQSKIVQNKTDCQYVYA